MTNLNEGKLNRAAKAYWEMETHPLIEQNLGTPATWENIPEILRRGSRNVARVVLKSYLESEPNSELLKTLLAIANNVTSEEGDVQTTEDTFGLDVSEVIEMAHDEMIWMAREAVKKVGTYEIKS